MLSLFPKLFSYALVVPFVFRIVIGLTFIWFGYQNITKNRDSKISLLANLKLSAPSVWLWIVVVIEMLGGLLLLLGTYTQLSALILSIILVIAIKIKHKKPETLPLPQTTYLLLLLVTASLLFLGAGFYAFDLPL